MPFVEKTLNIQNYKFLLQRIWYLFQIKLYDSNLHKTCGKSSLLDRTIRNKLDPKTVGRGFDVLGHLVSAKCPNERSSNTSAISYLQKVVNTVIMVFNFKRLELEGNLEIIWHPRISSNLNTFHFNFNKYSNLKLW